MMPDFENLSDVKKLLLKAQQVETDNREAVREADHFLNKRDGQWEPDIVRKLVNRPRYTFDKCNPIVDQIMAEIEQSDFEISIAPAGGGATKDLAKTYNGLIRNIEDISNARDIYNAAGRIMVSTGLDGWRIVQDWVDSDSFEQDLIIKKIPNFVDRVWFDIDAVEPDMSDANWGFLLHSLSKDKYDETFPGGSGISVNDDKSSEVYNYKKEEILVGEFFYKKKTKRTLILMTNNAIYEDDEKYQSIKDELALKGITERRRREREQAIVFTHFFDGGSDWLEPEKETVFEYIPLIPTYGNFKISENKVIYRGAIEKLMDPQRIYNYAKSRELEEGALAPRDKIWMTHQQAEGEGILGTLKTLNTNADPVQFYNSVVDQRDPYKMPGGQTNPGLRISAEDANRDINEGAGLFAANMGDNPGLQSGIAIELQQDKGDNSTYKYFKAQRVPIQHTCRILIKAIPKVYDSPRQQRLLNLDGSEEIVTLHDKEFDTGTQEVVEINNLSIGKYAITCTVGPAFRNKQQETVKTITEIAKVDPSILQIGADILLNNINAPGISQIAERKRAQMVMQGLIPKSQMTEEEKTQLLLQSQQGNQEPSVVEQALLIQSQAEMQKAQAGTADILSKIDERNQKVALQSEKQQQDFIVATEKIELQQQETTGKLETLADQIIKLQAETLKILREAMGVDSIVGPGNIRTYEKQVERIDETQDQTL